MRRLHKIPILLGKETILFNDLKDWLLGKMQLFVSILILLVISHISYGGTKTWVPVGTGAWTIPTNWNPSGLPGAGDDVIFNCTSNANITLVPSATINSLSLLGTKNVTFQSSGGSTITIDNGTATAAFNISSGHIITLGAGGAANAVNLTFKTVTAATTISGSLNITANSTITVNASQTLTILAGGAITIPGGTINNSGVISNSGTISFSTANAVYNHNQDGGTIPPATWTNNTNCNVNSLISTAPAGLNQTFGNVTINCAGLTSPVTISTGGNMTVAGSLLIQGTSAINTLSLDPDGFNLSVTGTTSINDYGNIIDSNDGGTNTFTGAITISTNGSLTTGNNSPFTISGGITNHGIFNQTGTGTITLGTETLSGSGTTTFNGTVNITINKAVTSTTTVTINGILTGLGGGSSWTNGNNSVLNFGNNSKPMALGSFNLTGIPNTVNYSSSGDQTIAAWNYYNLSIAAGARNITLANAGTIGIANTFSPGAVTAYTITNSTIEYNGDINQTTVLGNSVNFPAYYNLTISIPNGGASNTKTTSGTGIVVNNNLSVLSHNAPNTCTFSPDGFDLSVTGTSTIGAGGIYSDLLDAGVNTFTGTINLTNNGVFTSSNTTVGNLLINGGINQTSSGNLTTGKVTFGASQNIIGAGSGAINLGDVVIGNGFTVNNQRTVNISSSLTGGNGSSTWTNANNSTLNYAGAGIPMPTGIITASAATNTVNYNANGAQSVLGTTYSNLTISVSGTKTLSAATSVNNNLTISGTAILASDIYQITGNGTGLFQMAAGTGLTLGNTLNVAATLFPSAFVTANITLDPASTVTYQANAAQNISIVPTYGNLAITTGAAPTSKTPTGTPLNIGGGLAVNNNGAIVTTFSFGGIATTVNVAGNLSGTGTIGMTGALAHILNLGGANNAIGTFNTTAGSGSTVNYNSAGNQQVFASLVYRNLTISGSGIKTLQGAITVNNTLSVTGGTLASDIYQITGVAGQSFTMGAGTGLTLGSASSANNILFPLLYANANINLDPASTVTYQSNAAQTVSIVPTYGSLAVANGNTKTGAGNITVKGSLIIQAATTLSLGGGAATWAVNTISGNDTIRGTLDFGGTVLKSVTLNGNLVDPSGTGTININYPNLANALTLNGANNALHTLSTSATGPVNYSIVTYNAAGSQQVFGSPNYQNLTISNSGTKTLTGALTVNHNLSIAGSAILASDIYQITGSANTFTMANGTGFTLGNTGNATAVTFPIFTTTTFTPTCTVTYQTGGNQNVLNLPYSSLTINGGGTKTLQGGVASIAAAGTLTLTSGIFELGNNNLTIINTAVGAITTGTSYSSTNMIATDGTGYLIRSATTIPAASQIFYPVGSVNGGSNYYSPSGYTITAGGFGGTINVRSIFPVPALGANYLKTYWEVITTGAGKTITATLQNDPAEVNGVPSGYTAWYKPIAGNWQTPPPGVGTYSWAANILTITGTTDMTTTSTYWTAGTPTTYYSYQTGNWNTYSTWTQDPSGTTQIGNSIPGLNDNVVILSGRTVSLSSNITTLNLNITINSGGFLNLSTFSFSNGLLSLAGQGILQLASTVADNFPAVPIPTNTFILAGGGTTEYDASVTMTQATHNNLTINAAGGTVLDKIATLLLNGNLLVKQGTFKINDDVTSTRFQLTVSGNVTVNSGAVVKVGKGNTVTGIDAPLTVPPGGVPPFINYYDHETHRIVVKGDFTNNGIVKFTNQLYPDYAAFPATGAATVYFQGSTYNTLTCNDTTDFYNLVLDKGTDQTFSLTINSNAYNYFRLFGANVAAGDIAAGPPAATNSNPSLKKALWIRSGTLDLKGLVILPSLTEGFTAAWPSSDFIIPANGALVLDGTDVIVLSTADDYGEVNFAYGVSGGTGQVHGVLTAAGTSSGLAVLGKLQVNNGYLSTRESAGLLYTSYASGQFILNNGTVDTKQFHDITATGTTGLISYVQTGGTAIYRGRFQHPLLFGSIANLVSTALNTARAASNTDGTVGSFYIGNGTVAGIDNNGYTMTGGTMTIYDVLNINSAYAFEVLCPVSNINISGGTVQMIPTTGSVPANDAANFMIRSTAPIENLLINRASSTSAVQLSTLSLKVLQNLTLQSGVFDANSLDIGIGGNFSIASGTTYTTGTNRTLFNGTGKQTFTVNLGAALSLNKFIINKAATDTLIFAGTQKTINVNDSLMIVGGCLGDNGDTIKVLSTAAYGGIYNAGVHFGTGKIALVSSTHTQAINGNGSGVFNNLDLNNTFGVAAPDTLYSNITITGTLKLVSNKIFVIGSNNLNITASGTISSTPGFSNSCFVQTAGLSGDGGITKTYSASSTIFAFPLGAPTISPPLAAVYTPDTIIFTSAPTTWGSITVRPVGIEQPATTTKGHNLTYYWRVKNSGFSGYANSVTHSYTYNPADVPVPGDLPNYVPARFDESSFTWTNGTHASVNTGTHLIDGPWLNGTSNIDGDYTAGLAADFGVPTKFYSRQSGQWNLAATWSTVSPTGPAASRWPYAKDIAIIGNYPARNDSVFLPSSFAAANNRDDSCATLIVESGSVLDVGNNANSVFSVVQSYSGGNGKIKVSATNVGSSNPFVIPFPSGDFSDFNNNGGTTHYYTGNNNYAQYYLSPTVTTYGNLIFSPAGTDNIIFPNANVIINGNCTNFGTTTDSWLCPSWYDGPACCGMGMAAHTPGVYHTIEKTIHITGNLIMNGGTFFYTSDGNVPQHVIVDGNVIIGASAGLDVFYNPGGNYFGNTTQLNTLIIGGNLVNNSDSVRFNYNNGSRICDITFNGLNNATISNTLTPAAINFHKVTVNKGGSQATTLTINFTGLIEFNNPADNWLFLQNGTLIDNHIGIFPISTVTAFTIPATAGLTINNTSSNVLIANAAADNNDMYLNGKLTLTAGFTGNVYIGQIAAPNNNNDIEYSSGGASAIEVDGGNLTVNGQIRRNPSNTAGILSYTQTGGAVTINGRNHNLINAKLGIANPGSQFNMSGGTLTIVRGGGTTFGDLYLRPQISSVTGGTILFVAPLSAPNANQTYLIDATVPLNNVTITGFNGANTATVTLMTSPLVLNGALTISNANSTLDANNALNVPLTIKGDFSNSGTYNAQKNLTTFSGNTQNLLGTTVNTFYDLNVNPVTSLTLNHNFTVSDNLTLSSGTLIIAGNEVFIAGAFTNNANFTDNNVWNTGISLNGTTLQHISGTGTFGGIELNNAAGSYMDNSISLSENLYMTKGIFNVDSALLTLSVNSNIVLENGIAAPYSNTKMLATQGVFSNIGVRKFFNSIPPLPSPTSFLYPIGTSGKYTPATITFAANGFVGSIRINNVNSTMPTVIDPTKALKYFWDVESSGIANFSGSLALTYSPGDVMGNVNFYKSVRLIVPGTSYSMTNGMNIPQNKDTFIYNYPQLNLCGEYTAGYPSAFPANVPTFTSNKNGNWTDNTIWTQTGGSTYTLPVGTGPNGFNVIIAPNDTVTVNANYCSAYQLTINGKLKVVAPYFGHNFGTVDGNGTLYLESGTFPAGVFTDFLNCGTGGTIEYGGSGSYSIIADLYNQVPGLLFSGSGSRILPNKDLIICNSFIINGPTVIDSVYNHKLTMLGTMERLSGTFTSGSGAGATVTFGGSSGQTIGGATYGDFAGANALNNLEINNSSGLTINTNGNIEVGGNLLLTSGLINTTSTNKLTITNTSDNCVIPAGGSAASYVNGPLTKVINPSHNFAFPIGQGGIPGNKITLTAVENSQLKWTAQYLNPDTMYLHFTSPLLAVSQKEYWKVSLPTGTPYGKSAIINLNWDPTSDITPLSAGSLAALRVAYYNTGTSKWVALASSASGTNYYGTVSTTSNDTLPASDTANFTIGSTSNVKPRARLSPTLGYVCGNTFMPVTFTVANGTIPPWYVLSYTLNGAAHTDTIKNPATYQGIPVSPPTPPTLPPFYQVVILTGFKYNVPGGTTTGVVDATPDTAFANPTPNANAGPSQAICGVTTTNLQGNTPTLGTGLWKIFSGTGGTVITPTNPTSQFNGLNGKSYILKWTIKNGGCTTWDTTVINFTVLPDAPATSSPQSFCNAAKVSDLSATPPPLSSVRWYLTGTGGSPLLPSTSLITLTNYYAESFSGGCVSVTRDTVQAIINPLPVPTIGGSVSVCANQTGVTYSTESGMSGYTWNVTDGSITAGSGTNTITVTWGVAGPGNVSVNYTDANGCTALSPTNYGVTVNTLPVPTITGLNSVCANQAGVTYFTEAVMSGYIWNVTDGSITGGGATNLITVTWGTAGAGQVTVNYNDANGCSAASPTIEAVTVTPVPNTGPMYRQPNE